MVQAFFLVFCNVLISSLSNSQLLKEIQEEKVTLRQAQSVDAGFVIRYRIWKTRKLICSALNRNDGTLLIQALDLTLLAGNVVFNFSDPNWNEDILDSVVLARSCLEAVNVIARAPCYKSKARLKNLEKMISMGLSVLALFANKLNAATYLVDKGIVTLFASFAGQLQSRQFKSISLTKQIVQIMTKFFQHRPPLSMDLPVNLICFITTILHHRPSSSDIVMAAVSVSLDLSLSINQSTESLVQASFHKNILKFASKSFDAIRRNGEGDLMDELMLMIQHNQARRIAVNIVKNFAKRSFVARDAFDDNDLAVLYDLSNDPLIGPSSEEVLDVIYNTPRDLVARFTVKEADNLLSVAFDVSMLGLRGFDNSCSICMEAFVKGSVICVCKCNSGESSLADAPNHAFHKKCLQQWVCQEAVCPNCRAPVTIPVPVSISTR